MKAEAIIFPEKQLEVLHFSQCHFFGLHLCIFMNALVANQLKDLKTKIYFEDISSWKSICWENSTMCEVLLIMKEILNKSLDLQMESLFNMLKAS